MTTRKRLTDHEKTVELVKAITPITNKALNVASDLISIPAVGIAAAVVGITILDNEVIRPRGYDFIALEGVLVSSIALAAVVPAIKSIGSLVGPLAGLFGGGAT